jgi:RloB-like protein
MSRKDRSNSGQGYSDRKMGNRKPIPTFLIVCEGAKTEPNYFRSFPVSTRPEIEIVGAGCETISVVRKALELNKDGKFNRVWCVFDRDPSPDKTAQRFNNALQLAKSKGISVAYSNECFEIWYLLHFNLYNTAIPRKDYGKLLTKLLQMEYEKNSEDMYKLLEDNQSKAIKHATKLLASYDPHNPESDNPVTTVHLLVEELNQYIR